MKKALVRLVINELCLGEANVPAALKLLPHLRPKAQRIVVRYLRPHLERMDHCDIQKMLESGRISVGDMDFFMAVSEAMGVPPSDPPRPPRSWRPVHWLTRAALLDWLYTKIQLIVGLFRIAGVPAAAEPMDTRPR